MATSRVNCPLAPTGVRTRKKTNIFVQLPQIPFPQTGMTKNMKKKCEKRCKPTKDLEKNTKMESQKSDTRAQRSTIYL